VVIDIIIIIIIVFVCDEISFITELIVYLIHIMFIVVIRCNFFDIAYLISFKMIGLYRFT